MSEGQVPSNVHVLKPRTMSLSDRLDAFLDSNALNPEERPVRRDPTRPQTAGINAIKCASCGQAEYLTRDYCRFGHYLRGQLEDEFLAWEAEIRADHERLAEDTQRKLKPLRLLYLVSLPFIITPLIDLAFWPEGPLTYLTISMLVGFVLLGSLALAESVLMKPVRASIDFLQTYTFESFVGDRFFRQMMTFR